MMMKTCFFTFLFFYTCKFLTQAQVTLISQGNPTFIEGFTTGGNGRPLRFTTANVDRNDPSFPRPFQAPTSNFNAHGLRIPALPTQTNLQTYCSSTNANSKGCVVYKQCQDTPTSLDSETCSITAITYSICQTQPTAFPYCSEAAQVCEITPEYCKHVNTMMDTAYSMSSKPMVASPLSSTNMPTTPTLDSTVNTNVKLENKVSSDSTTMKSSDSTTMKSIAFKLSLSFNALVMCMLFFFIR